MRVSESLQVASYLAIIFGVLIAFSAIFVTKRSQREGAARRAYFDYVKFGFENPTFAFPNHLDMNLDAQTVNNTSEELLTVCASRFMSKWFGNAKVGFSKPNFT